MKGNIDMDDKTFEERWGFAPDSDYEIRKTNKSEEIFGMTREEWEKTFLKAAKMSCDEQAELLERAKNRQNEN